MDGLLGQNEGLARLAVFAGVFVIMAAIELIRPKRRLSVSKARRWLTNLGIAGTDTLVLRLMTMLAVPVAAVSAALFAQEHGLGLLNHLAWPYWIKLVIALLVSLFISVISQRQGHEPVTCAIRGHLSTNREP